MVTLTRLAGCLVAIGVLLLGLAAARAQESMDWSGTWGAHWAGGDARIEIRQTGDEIIGSIPLHGGQIAGRASGAMLRGSWSEGGGSGKFAFRMSADRKSFSGRFDDGAWWTGERMVAATALPHMDQSTPRAALRSFLLAGDRALAGVPDAIGRAAMVMEFAGATNGYGIIEQIQLAQDTFDLANLTTVRLWQVPEASYADQVAVVLEQRGSGAAFTLMLHRLNQGLWWVVAPDAATLATTRKALLARFDGRLPARTADRALPTPRDTMRAFLEDLAAWDTGGRGRILNTLDLRAMPEATRASEGELAALSIAQVLQRAGPVITPLIPDDPAGRNPYIHFVHPAGRIAIAPVEEDGHARWKFTEDTVASARHLFAGMLLTSIAPDGALPVPAEGYFYWRHWVATTAPVLLRPIGFLRLERWQVSAIAGAAVVGLLAGLLLSLLARLLPRWLMAGLAWPICLLAMATALQTTLPELGLPHQALQTSRAVAALLLALGAVWAGWKLIDRIGHRLAGNDASHALAGEIVVPLAIGVVRVLLVGVAVVYAADALSIPYGGLVAGLGISGLALAFASKETLSNIFGAAILVVDRPFRRGDMIVAGDTRGTVEHVGIRSTRIRTAEDSVIVLPNGKLSDATINNFGTRRHRLASASLMLPYRTAPEKIAAFTDALAALLQDRPGIAPGRSDIAVSGLTPGGIQVDMTCYLAADGGREEKKLRQALMLDIIRLADRLGVPIAEGHAPRVPDDAAREALAAE